jgi:immune inhibitor A
MSITQNRWRVLPIVAALLAFSLGVLAAPAVGLASPPSPDLLNREKNDPALEKRVDSYLSGAKAAGVDAPNAPLDLSAVESPWTPAVAALGSSIASTNRALSTGTYRQLVLLVDFSDNPGVVAPSFFDNLMFKDVVGPASVRGYYHEVSGGVLDIQPVATDLPSVIGWLRMPQTYAYYVNNSNGTNNFSYPRNSQKLAEDAFRLAEAAGVDFSRYDNNGDGVLDGVVIVHAGPGAEITGKTTDIWSHKWSVSARATYDGVRTSSYSIQPERWYTPGDMTTGVYCHELGHIFGLGDLYDTVGSSQGIGNWSLMAGGSWNGNRGDSPARFDPYSAVKLGFETAAQVTSAATLTVRAASGTTVGDLYRVEKSGVTGGKEYFLIENRQKTGTDARLPGAGLMIWHVDETRPNNDNAARYLVDVEEAHGGTQNLATSSQRGDPGDPFPGTSNKREFSELTDPNSHYYDGSGLVNVTGISASGNTMTARVAQDRAVSDTTPPETISDARATYDTSATITLLASDGGSAVVSTDWTLDGVAGSGSVVTVATYGSHHLAFRSTDAAGNVEATKTNDFFVRDVTAPTVTSDIVGSYVGTATIRVTATDGVGGSGVAAVVRSYDAGAPEAVGAATSSATYTTLGMHTLTYWAVDRAGNAATAQSFTFMITRPLPASPVLPGAFTVAVTTARVDWSPAADATSYDFRVNGGDVLNTFGTGITVYDLHAGANTFAVRSRNENGVSAWASTTITYALPTTEPPTAEPTTTQPPTPGGTGTVVTGSETMNAAITYGAAGAIVTVTVRDAHDAAIADRQVVYQYSYDNVTWTNLATMTTDVSGIATYTFKADRNVWVRPVVAGADADASTKTGTALRVSVAPSLGRPTVPSRVTHRHTFTIYGYLKPRHASGHHDVVIKLYRRAKSGAYAYYKTVTCKNSNYNSTTTKFSVRTSVSSAGTYRAYAYYKGSANYVASTSTYRQFSAR